MAIIYSYPTVTPTSDDLILGTDINADGKPTKNFTIQSIVDIVQGGAAGLGAVIKINSSAKDPATAVNQSAIDFLNVSGTGTASFGALSDGTLQITGGNLTTTGTGSFSQVTGVLQTAAQPNVTSLGILTSLKIGGATPAITSIVTTLAAPGDDIKLATTKAIVDYIATKPNTETLAETLIAGQTTGGKDIIVSAGDDITFTDTSKIILGTGSDATVEHDGTDLKILNTEGKTTISNSSGDIDISATATAKKLNLNGKAGVELKFDGNKQFETIINGSIATGTFNATGLLTAQTNLWFKDKIGIGGAGAPDYGTVGQVLSSGGALSDATWEDLTPLYSWIIEADSGTGQPYTVASGETIDFVGGDNINTSWVNAGKELKIDATGLVQKGTGAATQVAYWTDANTIAGDAGMVYDAVNDYLTLAGTVKSGTFTTTAGTATWTTTVLDNFTSITSDIFVGDATAATVPSSPPWPANPTANVQFQGNASSANVLKLVGAVSISQGAAPSAGAENTQGVSSVAGQTYTSGGNITIETTLASTVATAKRLTNLPTPSSAAITASDTILAAMAKLQGQINGIAGSLAFEGTWDASTGNPPSASPVNGQFWIVSVAGSTNLSGITDWKVGDWAIYVNNGAGTDAWQKLDQSNEVLGSGTAQKIAIWSGTVGDASQTLATGLIEQNASNNLITIGNSGSLLVEGNTTLGDSDTDTVLSKGPVTLNKTLNIKEGIKVNGAAGTSGQVLTSGSGSAAVMSWTTPTTGTVTSVTAGTGITIGGTAADPTVAIDYLGTDNAILAAPQENGIATTDIVWFSDATDNNIKKTTVANLISLDPARSLAATLAIGNTSGANNILMADSQSVNFGAGNDLIITHDATNSIIGNVTGNLYIRNDADDADIVFQSDDGSGGRITYFQVDGGETNIKVFRNMRLNDDVQLRLGTSSDLRIYHDATNSIIDNKNGNLILEQNQDDGDIIFKADNGSGGVTEYFRVDGGAVETRFSKSTRHFDNVGAYFGDSADLQIYHDGSNSYISDSGTGNLLITSDGASVQINKGSTENMAEFIVDGAVNLYYDSAKKFETTTGGVSVTGDADVSGEVQVGGQGSNFSENNLRFKSAGAAYIDHAITSQDINFRVSNSSSLDTTAMIIKSDGDVEFKDDVEIDGNLTVDGHIIHGGGGGGTGKGGQFTKLFTSVSGGSVAFTIDRATTGTMVFDVMFTSDTSTTTSIAKKYTVIATYGPGFPIYNKILDSGPDANGADFTVAFADDTSNTRIKCTITPVTTATQKIGITIDLGFGQNNATVVMN